MLERPYCFDGCKHSPFTRGQSLAKDGVSVCDKYPTGMPFVVSKANEECPVAKGEEE